jgi:hypothetical protein
MVNNFVHNRLTVHILIPISTSFCNDLLQVLSGEEKISTFVFLVLKISPKKLLPPKLSIMTAVWLDQSKQQFKLCFTNKLK